MDAPSPLLHIYKCISRDFQCSSVCLTSKGWHLTFLQGKVVERQGRRVKSGVPLSLKKPNVRTTYIPSLLLMHTGVFTFAPSYFPSTTTTNTTTDQCLPLPDAYSILLLLYIVCILLLGCFLLVTLSLSLDIIYRVVDSYGESASSFPLLSFSYTNTLKLRQQEHSIQDHHHHHCHHVQCKSHTHTVLYHHSYGHQLILLILLYYSSHTTHTQAKSSIEVSKSFPVEIITNLSLFLFY